LTDVLLHQVHVEPVHIDLANESVQVPRFLDIHAQRGERDVVGRVVDEVVEGLSNRMRGRVRGCTLRIVSLPLVAAGNVSGGGAVEAIGAASDSTACTVVVPAVPGAVCFLSE